MSSSTTSEVVFNVHAEVKFLPIVIFSCPNHDMWLALQPSGSCTQGIDGKFSQISKCVDKYMFAAS